MRRLALLVLLAAPAAAQDGAAVFDRAEGLEARLGSAEGPILPAGQFRCAGCHGPDGRGGSEGGSQPAPPIHWDSLAAPTPERPAYDQAALVRLLTQGVTPSGRVISSRMPRFQASPQTFAALTGHLRLLDAQESRGLTADAIALSLPGDPGARDAALAAIAAFNAEGGAFGRRIVVADPSFVDLETVLVTILPRLRQAEDERLEDLMAQDRGLRAPQNLDSAARIAGTMDQLGPQLPALLSQVAEIQAIGPSSEAMSWALSTRHDASAAHAYAAIRAALGLFRDQGRMPTRSGFSRALEKLDLDAAIEVYRQTGR